MIIRFDNTMDDLVAFNRYHCKHSPTVKTIKLISVMFVAILVLGVSLAIDPTPDIARPLIVGGAVAFVILFAFIFNYTFRFTLDWQTRRMYNEGANKGVLGQHELEIDKNGLVERTDVNETRNSWQGVERIAETDDHAFVYLSAIMAHVIPKHSISAGDPKQFIATAKEMWLAANPERRHEHEA